MHRSIHISSVYRDIPFCATLDYCLRRKPELVVVAAAAGNGPGLEGIQEFFAARISAAVVSCNKKRFKPSFKDGNDRLFLPCANIAGQNHPGPAIAYLEHERDLVEVPFGPALKKIACWMEQTHCGLTDLRLREKIRKCANRYLPFQRDFVQVAVNAPALLDVGGYSPAVLILPGDSTRPETTHVEIAKDESKSKPMIGVIVGEGHVVEPADSLVPEKRSDHPSADIV